MLLNLYRYSDINSEQARIFVGVWLSYGVDESDEMARLHVRYMVGGRPSKPLNERLLSFVFPESPGALLKFLQTLGSYWNITLFHYRSHGTDYGRVLAAFELSGSEALFEQHLAALGYEYYDETNNTSFQFFLAPYSQLLTAHIGNSQQLPECSN